MKLFEETSKPTDAAALLTALFRDYKEVDSGHSNFISPSGLACQVACAWKVTGAPAVKEKESFQSKSFAEAGQDRHKRIQAFLRETPYWVNVAEYVKLKKLGLQVLEDDGYETLLYSPEFNARFRCDGMLFIEGNYYVLEIKTERQEVNSVRTGPEEKHQKQGIAYTRLLDTNRILWVYEGRNYLEQRNFVQLVTKQQKTEIAKYLKDIMRYKDTPEKLQQDTKSCPTCAYKPYCKMYFNELKKKEMLNGKQ